MGDSAPSSTGPAAQPSGPAAQQSRPEAPAPGGTSEPKFSVPEFMNGARAEPRDLPGYPRARKGQVRFGPYQDKQIFAATLTTRDSMDRVAAFYDDVLKSNGWKVSSRIVDPEYSEWIFRKDNDAEDEGKVVVQKEPSGNGLTISIARTSNAPKSRTAPTDKQS
jgi:hypothetical protein